MSSMILLRLFTPTGFFEVFWGELDFCPYFPGGEEAFPAGAEGYFFTPDSFEGEEEPVLAEAIPGLFTSSPDLFALYSLYFSLA